MFFLEDGHTDMLSIPDLEPTWVSSMDLPASVRLIFLVLGITDVNSFSDFTINTLVEAHVSIYILDIISADDTLDTSSGSSTWFTDSLLPLFGVGFHIFGLDLFGSPSSSGLASEGPS